MPFLDLTSPWEISRARQLGKSCLFADEKTVDKRGAFALKEPTTHKVGCDKRPISGPFCGLEHSGRPPCQNVSPPATVHHFFHNTLFIKDLKSARKVYQKDRHKPDSRKQEQKRFIDVHSVK